MAATSCFSMMRTATKTCIFSWSIPKTANCALSRDVPFDATATTWTMRFDAAGNHLYMISSIERDKAAVVQVDWATGEERTLFESDRADVTDLISNSQSFEPEAVAVDPARQQW